MSVVSVKHTKAFRDFLRTLKQKSPKERKRLISRRKKEVLTRLEMGPRAGTGEDEKTPWGIVVAGLLRGDPWGRISMRAGVSLDYIRFVRDEAGLGKEALALGRLVGEIYGISEGQEG